MLHTKGPPGDEQTWKADDFIVTGKMQIRLTVPQDWSPRQTGHSRHYGMSAGLWDRQNSHAPAPLKLHGVKTQCPFSFLNSQCIADQNMVPLRMTHGWPLPPVPQYVTAELSIHCQTSLLAVYLYVSTMSRFCNSFQMLAVSFWTFLASSKWLTPTVRVTLLYLTVEVEIGTTPSAAFTKRNHTSTL